ncbi:MAG: relaxase/mobilization nuclease domain-containing protein, partial [Christensenella hongkongensis]
IGGYNCNPQTALDEMKDTKQAWGKIGGRQYKHFIQSFPYDENITLDEANRIADELMRRCSLFHGYEVCYATHKDRRHIHTHLIANSVSFETGKKFRYSKRQLQEMKDLSDLILQEHGKTICEKNKEITSFRMGAYRSIEKAAQGNYQSWMLDTMVAVDKAMKIAVSQKEFIAVMSGMGYTVDWLDNRKYITFTNIDGKKVRNKTLSRTFKKALSKEDLINEFGKNIGNHRINAGGISEDSGRMGHQRNHSQRKQRTQRSAGELRRRLSDVSNIGEQYDVGKQAAKLRSDREALRNAERKNIRTTHEQPAVRKQHRVKDTRVHRENDLSR